MSEKNELNDALDVLLRRHGMRLRAAIERHCRCGRALDPDDIAQEVRIRLWRALERDRNAVFSASYLMQSVMSAVVDAVRRAPPASDPMQDFEGDSVQSWPEALVERGGPEARARTDALGVALNSALEALPQQRRLAVQFTLQGFSARECGELMGISGEAARKLAERGLVLVRDMLRQQGWGDFDE